MWNCPSQSQTVDTIPLLLKLLIEKTRDGGNLDEGGPGQGGLGESIAEVNGDPQGLPRDTLSREEVAAVAVAVAAATTPFRRRFLRDLRGDRVSPGPSEGV
ncbi:hypothetical protein B296_00015955 [Ensete ventricosum]|uniref:Uncharacterized protein n=1 Tax=Ensete ventricosum TaxID=4639 RepID=A0A427A041_ENSVE|nr:hypothetical protein B296_00015955 [Ensete ventricosum]